MTVAENHPETVSTKYGNCKETPITDVVLASFFCNMLLANGWTAEQLKALVDDMSSAWLLATKGGVA